MIKKEYKYFSYDEVFEKVFLDNINILAKFISDITNIDYKLLVDNIILEENEIGIGYDNEKFKKCDFILQIIRNKVVDFQDDNNCENNAYMFQLFYKNLDDSEELNVVHININYFNILDNRILSSYKLVSDNGEEYVKNSVIYNFNISECEKYSSNINEELPNYVRWGMLFNCTNFNDIPKIMDNVLTKNECELVIDLISK